MIPLLRFRSALHCGYIVVSLIKIAASNENIECFRELNNLDLILAKILFFSALVFAYGLATVIVVLCR
jgi:hypothetical protein